MRNISFMLTTEQVKNRTKTVTRRLGWTNLKVGERLQGCEKCMGRKKGEPLVKLAVIEAVKVRREPVDWVQSWGKKDVIKEGFPHLTKMQFIKFFCKEMKCTPQTMITRIEFKYVELDAPPH